MSQQQDLPREIAAASNSGAPDRITDWFTKDFRLHEPGALALPVGHPGARQMRARTRTLVPPINLEILDMVEEGDRVAVRWQLTATHDGKPFEQSIMAIYRFEGGASPRIGVSRCRHFGLKARDANVWFQPPAGGDPVKTKRARAAGTSPAGPAVAPPQQQVLWFDLMQFYIREAWLLDERKFKEWLDLFTDDVLYFMPRRKNVPRREAHRELTPLGDLAILEEDKRYLEMRVARLDTGMAWAEDPPSRTRHLIGNLEAAPLENGEVQAKTAFLVYRSHLETDHQLLSGCRDDLLCKVNGAWKVARRTIVLDANVLLDKNLSVFL